MSAENAIRAMRGTPPRFVSRERDAPSNTQMSLSPLTAIVVALLEKGAANLEARRARPFRILDLPAEIRNRIYGHYIAMNGKRNKGQRNKYNLANFKTPVIAQVSRQLRSEFLPVFFAEASWYVVLPCNLVDFFRSRLELPPREKCDDFALDKAYDAAVRVAGKLGIKRPVKDLIRGYGAQAVFRDVTFLICDAEFVDEKNRAEIDKENVVMSFIMTYREKKVNTKRARKTDFPAAPHLETRGFGFEQRDIRNAVGFARRVVKHIGSREGFNGFTHGDLEEIAKVFRHDTWAWPRLLESHGVSSKMRVE
ncbi:Hypothetical predicted protein [Lecanosticta acicola]|uniref:Uncharacterized protein n=1 Tax=Lecanosticta acicola TaxID=111012 RepID=A0AAI9E7K5_9PEZI|nr:Hypothetical predicted protein [Lecanosticta acicola]